MARTERLGVFYDRLPIIDVHTHTSGPDDDGDPNDVVHTMDECGVEQAFCFAPLLSVHGLELIDEHMDDVRRHNVQSDHGDKHGHHARLIQDSDARS